MGPRLLWERRDRVPAYAGKIDGAATRDGLRAVPAILPDDVGYLGDVLAAGAGVEMTAAVSGGFLHKIMPEPNSGCWLWMGVLDKDGYGHFGRGNGRPRIAHRLSYFLFVGEIPASLYVLHKCDVPCCVNPQHLFLGTAASNYADSAAKGRNCRGDRHGYSKRTHCTQGHEYSTENTYLRLSRNSRVCRACKNDRERKRYANWRSVKLHGERSRDGQL